MFRTFLIWIGLASAALAQDVVILGEVHDNPHHHARQAQEVAALSPRAIVFEMLTPEQAAAGQGVDRGDATALAAAFEWAGSGWPDFTMYHPIFAASDARFFGGALPRETVRRAVGEGAAKVLDDPHWPLGPLPADEQAMREAEQMEAHCNAMPAEMMAGMVEAQRLRDAALARAVLAAYETTGGPVVLITGNGHARKDRGVPYMLAHVRPDLVIDTLGQFEEGAEWNAPPFDRVAVSPMAEREDPCAIFTK